MFPAATNRSDEGFTLLELLVVVALISMVMAVAPAIHARLIPSYQLRQAANDVANAGRQARQRARLTGDEGLLVISEDRQTVMIDGGIIDLPDGTIVEMTLDDAFSKQVGSQIRFYPSGAVSGGDLSFSNGNTNVSVRFDWASGAIEVEQ